MIIQKDYSNKVTINTVVSMLFSDKDDSTLLSCQKLDEKISISCLHAKYEHPVSFS